MRIAIYLKSFIVGLVAAAVLTPMSLILYIILSTPRVPGVSLQYDLRSVFSFGEPWLAAIVIFASGFLWEFRRASRYPFPAQALPTSTQMRRDSV